jgi:hypothetical protein
MSRVDPPAEQIYGLLIVPPSRWRSIWSMLSVLTFAARLTLLLQVFFYIR